MFSMREVFDLAIQIEKNGEQYYRDAIKKISNPSLNSLLEWLADQEEKHQSWFSERKETLETEGNDLELAEMSGSILQGILGDQSFSLKEADLSRIDSMEALIQLAVEFEKDSILFYEMIGSFIKDSETSEKLNEIIAEENRHIELLEDFQETEGNSLEKREDE
ncbi:MAG: ferritin family protein [Desulfobacteraceae bacterium]|nr:ferritin family protein [Desulfobacteraceae bacterium]